MSAVEDREEIHDLYGRYALAIDQGEYEEWVGCFSEDGIFESPRFGRHSGHAGLRKFTQIYRESLQGAQVRHVISNILLDLRGDEASGICYLTYYHSRSGSSHLAAVGSYRDELKRIDGRWLFRSRKVSIDG